MNELQIWYSLPEVPFTNNVNNRKGTGSEVGGGGVKKDFFQNKITRGGGAVF